MKTISTLATLIPLLVALPLTAQDHPGGLITVSGSASVERPPDTAVVRLGIQTQAPTASEAQKAANGVAASILASLGELGIAGDAIQTSRLQLFPVFESAQPGMPRHSEPRVVGYRATNAIAVTLDDLDRIGPVIDRSIDSGANRIDSVDLRLEDDEEARREALGGAVRDARAKAEVIAAALDQPLGAVIEVSEGGISAPPIVYRETAAIGRMASDAATPISTGSLTVSASVTVRYRLASGGSTENALE